MRLLVTFIFLFIDLFFNGTFAQSASNEPLFSFAPPASDASLVYLSNLFGIVDGVLAGTGSQIFGHMMGVFNMAVLAISSLTTTYVLVLGTVNTAHEGEFLGKQWSSIMIPLRITTGMALLAPKLSGYCAVQIIFMWVVVQGVGAADKIWNAALSYLNQGGQLVSQQISSRSISNNDTTVANPNNALNAVTGVMALLGPVAAIVAGGVDSLAGPDDVAKAESVKDPVYVGAGKMLSGIVCMYGLQQWISNLHATNCQNNNSSDFCKAGTPDLLSTIDAVDFAKHNPSPYHLNMPNVPPSSTPWYPGLNGVCGYISWNAMNAINDNFSTIVGGSDNSTVQNTRNIAVQTMYTFLTNVGMAIVNNDPVFNTNLRTDSTIPNIPYAKIQFGSALQKDGTPCFKLNNDPATGGCSTWGAAGGSTALFTGNEFLNAILAYYGVMQPYFSLVEQKYDETRKAAALKSRDFIAEAQNEGWMYAGAYFFKLINLSNSNVMTAPMTHDFLSGLEKSHDIGDKDEITKFPDRCEGNSPTDMLCWIKNESKSYSGLTPLVNLRGLILGAVSSPTTNTDGFCSAQLSFNPSEKLDLVGGQGYISPADGSFATKPECASTVYGFIGNSVFLNIAGNSTADPSDIDFHPPGFAYRGTSLELPEYNCSFFHLAGCIGNIFISLINTVTALVMVIVATVMNTVIDILIIAPMKSYLFPMLKKGMAILTTQTLNPVVKLANMGAYFIQKSIECYFTLIPVAMISAIASVVTGSGTAIAIATIVTMVLPIITSWLAYFVSVGVTTAYYVPLVPYMIFLFGVIGWFFSVIESMIAAPLVALIFTSPEGEGFVGKGETGIMILMNVFLRPSLMIIGFVSGIIMSTVSVWILTATFKTAAGYLTVSGVATDHNVMRQFAARTSWGHAFGKQQSGNADDPSETGAGQAYEGYGGLDWGEYPFANLFGSFFYIVTFVSVYVTLVQKSFSLIHNVPDKVMRWIGGQQESYGQDTSQWTEETKGAVTDFGKKTWQGIGEATSRPSKAIEDMVKADKEREKAGSGSVAADANAGPKKQAPP